MRLTRAQAAAQAAQIHTDETAEVVDSDNHDEHGRAPLSEIVANAVEPETPNQLETNKRSTRGKKAKEARADAVSQEEEEDATAVTTDDQDTTVPDFNDRDMDATVHEEEDGPVIGNEGKQGDEEGLSTATTVEPTDEMEDQITKASSEEIHTTHAQPTHPQANHEELSMPSAENYMAAESTLDEPRPDLLSVDIPMDGESPSVEPQEIILIPQRTPAKNLLAKEVSHMRSTSNKENEQPFNSPAVREPSSPVLSATSPMPVSTSQTDAVNGDMEHVSESSPTVGIVTKAGRAQAETTAEARLSPTKSSNRPSTMGRSPSIRTKDVAAKPEAELGRSPSVRTKYSPSKSASTPRKPASLHSDPTSPTSVRVKGVTPKAEPATRRTSVSVKHSTTKADPSVKTAAPAECEHAEPAKTAPLKRTLSTKRPLARASTVSKPATTREKTQTEIPHSKPRPISLSFPTPPAPPKSNKAPTKSSFQLPGEAVAAKLKAAREERLKKESEDIEKRRAFKARPAPKIKEGPPAVVRQTASSRARESLMLGKPPVAASSSETTTLKRASSVRESTVRPRASTATHRLSTVPKPLNPVAEKKPTTSALTVNKRASTIAPATSKPRASSVTTTSTAQRTTSTTGTKKGKEVFQRATAEKEAIDKQKRLKEEAAKKARDDAAERSRVASREWAEKARLKSLKAKVAQQQQQQKDAQQNLTAATTMVDAV